MLSSDLRPFKSYETKKKPQKTKKPTVYWREWRLWILRMLFLSVKTAMIEWPWL